MCGAQMALVSLIDEDRQWFKAKIGLEAAETCRSESFCAHAILDEAPLHVPDATVDPRFEDNPLVLGAPHIRGYHGFPLILQSGVRVGTLCVIFTAPREGPFHLTSGQTASLAALARATAIELDTRGELVRERVCRARLSELIRQALSPAAALDRNHDIIAVSASGQGYFDGPGALRLDSFDTSSLVDDVLCQERERLVSDGAGRTWRARPWRNALGACEGVVIDLWDDAVALAG